MPGVKADHNNTEMILYMVHNQVTITEEHSICARGRILTCRRRMLALRNRSPLNSYHTSCRIPKRVALRFHASPVTEARCLCIHLPSAANLPFAASSKKIQDPDLAENEKQHIHCHLNLWLCASNNAQPSCRFCVHRPSPVLCLQF